MRFLFLTFLLASTPSFSWALANDTVIAHELTLIPTCGLECLQQSIPLVGCQHLDFACQCASTKLPDVTAVCLYANCTLEQALEASKATAVICERPSNSQNHMLRIMTYVCCPITNAAIVARFLIRYLLGQQLRLDDLFIIFAAISAAVFTYFGVLFEDNGFGSHIWDVDATAVPKLLRWFFICEALYISTIALVKISILCFYLNVFPSKTFRRQCYTVLIFVIACAITFILCGIFQCTPVERAWNLDIGGKCIDYNAVGWTNAAVNILQDIIIVCLPINELRKLQVSSRRKVGLYAMFGVGGFVCITGIIRLYTLKKFGLTSDPTWDNVPTTFWSTMETTSAIFCACMPTMRAGLGRMFPKLFGSVRFFSSKNVTSSDNSTWKKVSNVAHKISDSKSWPLGSSTREIGEDEFIMLDTKHAAAGGYSVQISSPASVTPDIHDLERGRAATPYLRVDKDLPTIPQHAFSR